MAVISELIQQVYKSLIDLVQNIGPLDLLDILVVAFAIYHLIQFISRTNSARVARVIGFVLVFVWLADLLQLNTIHYILNLTLELGFLALVIIFQPEIRRILEQVGSKKFMVMFGRQPDNTDVENAIAQTVLACTQLSKDKTGALIVFERELSLSELIKTGTVIDANVTSELLKNIFFDKAPLHDGAVIIGGGRIIGGGCMLPLSNNINLSRDLGMRHRAGIGVSEKTDAVTVIVSEETGSLSVAVNGMLKRHLTLDTFERLLRNELIVKKDESRDRARKFADKFKVKKR